MCYENLDIYTKAALNLGVYIYYYIEDKKLINRNTNEELNDNQKKVLSFLRSVMHFDYNNLFIDLEPYNIFSCIYCDGNLELSKLSENIIGYYNQDVEYKEGPEFLRDISNIMITNCEDESQTDIYSLDEFVGKILSDNGWVCNFFPKEKFLEFNIIFAYYSKIYNKKNNEESSYNIKKQVGIEDAISQMFNIPINLLGPFPLDKQSLDNKKDSDNLFNFLKKNGCNLTNLDYKYNPAIGREDLIEKIAISLETPTQQVILIGMPGVGKTSVVKGLAKKIKDRKYLIDREIIEIPALSFISGKGIVGSFEENMDRIIEELSNKGNVILFIDEINQIYNMGIEESNVMNILKKPISEGKIKIIGATTKEEYENTIKLDNAFSSRFDVYFVDELKPNEIKKIVLDRMSFLEEYYNNKLEFTYSQRIKLVNYLLYLTDRKNRKLNEMSYNPRLIIQLIDTIFATAKVKHPNENGINKEDIIYAVRQNTKVKNSNYQIPDIFDNENIMVKDKNESINNIIDFKKYVKKI